MKTRLLILIAIVCIVPGSIFTVLGTFNYFEISKKIEEYPSSPLHTPGSSLPYPAYDVTWFYFGISGFFFVTSGLLYAVWRKRK